MDPRRGDTAGLGRDSRVLASAGAQVLQIESNALLASLLTEANDREDEQHSNNRVTLLHADAIAALPTLEADVVYLDPMYPERKKAAAVSREMQVLQALLAHHEDNALALLRAARRCQCKRIVLKRPKRSPPLLPEKRTGEHLVGNTRFDLYPREPDLN